MSQSTLVKFPPLTKGRGHLSVTAARKALTDGARMLSDILTRNWSYSERQTRSRSKSERSFCPELEEEYFKEATNRAEKHFQQYCAWGNVFGSLVPGEDLFHQCVQ